jgi:small-conductance mechanosensitive channel
VREAPAEAGVLNLLTVALISFSCLSILLHGWYGAALSLGVLSAILAFALQAPITSFFGWIYLL